MGAAYSVDLRRKIVQACEHSTASQAEVARFFGVSRSFVEKLLRLHRRTGGTGARQETGMPPNSDRCHNLRPGTALATRTKRPDPGGIGRPAAGTMWAMCKHQLRLATHATAPYALKKRLFMPLNVMHRMVYWHASTTARNLPRTSSGA